MPLTIRTLLAALALFLAAAAPAHAAPPAPTDLAVADLVADPGVVDPQFTWAAVSGARGYEVEINSTSYWAPGSKVCCPTISISLKVTTLGTSYSPPVVLDNNNEYYWRVRSVDATNTAGPWRAGEPFAKGFGTTPSVPGLRLAGPDLDTLAPGSTVDAPVVLWDAAPGASSYRVVVTPYTSGTCDWSASTSVRWEKLTATTGWTPLGWSRAVSADPLSRDISPASDSLTHLVAGQSYCVRVSPIDRASVSGGPVIESEWTYLPANNVPAFTWSGPPEGGDCVPCAPQASDYLRPVTGSTVGTMPVFTWNPVPGAQSYFLVVAKDQSFTNIADYVYTRVTAYAPRTGLASKGYADETSNYYWAVLPATEAAGQGVSIDPLESNPQPFKKQATPPALLGPSSGAVLSTAATVFHWSPVVDARRYRLQVSEDPTFSNVISERGPTGSSSGAVTDSTAYTSSTDYPVGKTLYWRVQAEAENGSTGTVGLRWSAIGTFQRSASASGPVADQAFRVTAKGYPVRKVKRKVTITVRNRSSLAPVAGARVRVSGAGVRKTVKRTGPLGRVTFRIRAKKYPGRVSYRVAKPGYKVTTYTQVVRSR